MCSYGCDRFRNEHTRTDTVSLRANERHGVAELSRQFRHRTVCPAPRRETGEVHCRPRSGGTMPPETEKPGETGMASLVSRAGHLGGQGAKWCTRMDCLPRKATFTALGLGGHWMDTAVMTPSVPSDPMKSCFRS